MATIDVINPATAETIDSVPNMTADEVDEVVETAKQALPNGSTQHRASAPRCCSQLADVIEENAEELAQIESRNVGKPLMASPRRDAVLRRQPALLRGRRTQPRGQVGRRVHQGLHVDDPPRADRHRRGHLPVELPADDGDLEARTGDRRRQRADPQAVRADADVAAALHGARQGRDPEGRPAGRHRRRSADR